MNGFVDAIGRVHAYRTDEPAKPLYVTPTSIGYEKFYYSQLLPDGTHENHRSGPKEGLISLQLLPTAAGTTLESQLTRIRLIMCKGHGRGE